MSAFSGIDISARSFDLVIKKKALLVKLKHSSSSLMTLSEPQKS